MTGVAMESNNDVILGTMIISEDGAITNVRKRFFFNFCFHFTGISNIF